MQSVRFTSHLLRFFPDLEQERLQAGTVAELVAVLDERHPGLGAYLLDENGALRPHVNIFIGKQPVRDRRGLADGLEPDAEVYVLQALSGG